MSEQTTDHEETPAAEPEEGPVSAKPPQKFRPWKIVLIVVVNVALALAVAYKSGIWEKQRRASSHPSPPGKSDSAFTAVPSDKLFSTVHLLASVGRAPGGGGQLQAPTLEQSPMAETGSATEAQENGQTPAAGLAPSEAASAEDRAVAPSAGGPGELAPKVVETPVIVPRGPGVPVEQPEEDKGNQEVGPDSSLAPDARKGPRKGNSDELIAGETSHRGKSKKAADAKKAARPAASEAGRPVHEESGQPEKFQLPGSLLLRIHGYSGTTVKWGMMVILDDSASMARHLKRWNPSRSEAAAGLVARLSEVATPGSRLAVRDFACGKPGEKKARCLSRVLYEWNDAPFKGLKKKLQDADPGGLTNPCAAAAYVAKRDIKADQGVVPRILLVTNGVAKCDFKDVLKALDRSEGKTKPVVDVVALGLARKREAAYSALAKKSGGVFLKADSPAELDHIVSRYQKILTTKAMEKVEVRGEKGVFSVNPGEELTLAPGSYTVVLPLVAGIPAAKRIISNVKISSGEAKVMEVRARRGKLSVQAGKK